MDTEPMPPVRRREPGHNMMSVSVDQQMLRNMRRWGWILLATAFVVYIAYLVREIWLPLTIALLIAMVLDPVVDRMERRGYKRLTGSIIIFVGFFTVLGTVLYFAVPAIVTQAQEVAGQLGKYVPSAEEPARMPKPLMTLLTRTKAPPAVRNGIEKGASQISVALTRSSTWVSQHGMELVSNLIWIVIIPIVSFYALKDFHLILGKGLLLVPRERRPFVQTMVSEVTSIFASFIRGLGLVSALNGLATWLLLAILGIPNAFALGMIAGLLYSVPYLGAITTIVLVAGVTLISKSDNINFVILVVGLNVLLHQVIFDQFITPRVLGGQVGLHPILSIISLLVGNVLLGIMGMILAVPVAASIQIIIVALVPKLRHEIDISNHPGDSPATGDLTKHVSAQAALDITEDMHHSVNVAVDNIEVETARMEAETNA